MRRDREIQVVAAVIRDAAGRILIARRPEHTHLGGLWEFPGGKVKPGEGARVALARELEEELGIRDLGPLQPLISIRHAYPDMRVRLEIWEIDGYRGAPRGCEGQRIAWVSPEALAEYPLPQADLPVLKAIGLPSRYLITPDPGTRWDSFLQRLELALRSGHALVQFRAKSLSESDYIALGRRVAQLCESWAARLLINGDPLWVDRVGAHGVHLSRDRLLRTQEHPAAGGMLLGVSCHTREDLHRAQRLDADLAVLSPVLPTLSHPEATPLGWRRFSALVDEALLPVYALGGLSDAELGVARACGAQGIAGIGALWPE